MESQLLEHFLASGASALSSPAFSKYMDATDPLRELRNEFEIPKIKNVVSDDAEIPDRDRDKECIYFCGNSLGLLPKKSRDLVERELKAWSEQGVQCWFSKKNGGMPWIEMEELEQPETKCHNTLVDIVGALPLEVAACNSLTGNLHNLFTHFYKPTPERHKILIEAKAFPSDIYAMKSQIVLHGFDHEQSLIQQKPRTGEFTLRTEDILELIEKEGDSIAVVFFSGVQFYTGQLFEIEKITAAAHAKGCLAGWDLAHAVGNVPLQLHDWNVDFAVWCTYKYLNSGPGGIGALFVHEKYAEAGQRKANRLAGWWAVDKSQRFEMDSEFMPRPGALGFIYSTPSMLQIASLMGSLQVFDKTSMVSLREKSLLLTGYLHSLLTTEIPPNFLRIMTPEDPSQRGAQLSLKLPKDKLLHVFSRLQNSGIICDERKPDCIRLAPVPLYSQFEDVRRSVEVLKGILKDICDSTTSC